MISRALEWLGLRSQGYRAGAAGHAHDAGAHGHSHGVLDAAVATSDRGIWAVKWSFVILALTTVLQLVVVAISGSVALLADTIHNFGDAGTAIPLWVAFALARRKPTPTFTYGYGRVEDLAGVIVVLIILISAVVAGSEAINRLIEPQPITQLGWVALAGIVGFIGNEAVAVLRIRVGREIQSAALIADGYHARTDGLTSLAVVLGAIGVGLGFPKSDPIVGLLITLAILGIVWQSGRAVFTRMLDGVEPHITAEVRHTAEHVNVVQRILDLKTRWLGHRLHVDLALGLAPTLTLAEAESAAGSVRRELRAHLPALGSVNITFGEQAMPASADIGHHDHRHRHGSGGLR